MAVFCKEEIFEIRIDFVSVQSRVSRCGDRIYCQTVLLSEQGGHGNSGVLQEGNL